MTTAIFLVRHESFYRLGIRIDFGYTNKIIYIGITYYYDEYGDNNNHWTATGVNVGK